MEDQSPRIASGEVALADEEEKSPVSERKLKANRENARKSTGPKTAQGKARSRFNAARHGILGSVLFLQGAEQSEFNRLVQDLRAEYQPVGAFQESLVEELAVCTLRKRLVLSFESSQILTQRENARESLYRISDVTPEARQLLACFKKAVRDVKRFGALRPETATELESLMADDTIQEFHEKFAKAGVPGLTTASGTGLPDTAGPPSGHTAAELATTVKKERLKVIHEYLDPLEEECQEENARLELRQATQSFLQSTSLENILRYYAAIDRRVAMLLVLLGQRQPSAATSPRGNALPSGAVDVG